MADQIIAYDPAKPVGQRLGAPIRAEIQEVAPSTVDAGSVTESKLADDAVTNPKIAPGAVDSVTIATGGVERVNIASEAVGEPQLAPHSVTPEKTGIGVVTAKDNSGNDLALTVVHLSAAQLAAIPTPNRDPNTLYIVT